MVCTRSLAILIGRYHHATYRQASQKRPYSPDGTGNRLSDGERMYLQVDKSGSKYWRMNYRFAGKDKTLALGLYPDVSLAAARKKRDDACEKPAAGIDPGEAERLETRAVRLAAANSFELVAHGWMNERKTCVEIGRYEKDAGMVQDRRVSVARQASHR